MNARFHTDGRPAGSVLIVVLIVCLGLVSLALVLGHSMILAYRGSENELAGRQADLAIEGAAQYAETLMANVDAPGDLPDPETYQCEAVPLGDANFWFIGEPDPTDTSNIPAFGLVDEASKLNLNTATLAMLENLPGMTTDLAQAIVAWRTSTSGSTESAYSDDSSSSSTGVTSGATSVKGAPFESTEELAMVNGGTDMLTLYGTDMNLNHVLDPNESSDGATTGAASGASSAAASASAPGLLEYVTIFSRQPNTLSDGTQRVNVTKTSGTLSSMITSTFGAARGQQINDAVRRAGAVKSVLEFYIKSTMTADEFAEISGSLCMSSKAYSAGLVNVNTASEAVLECVPGISTSAAAQIVTTREGAAEPITDLSWVAPILGQSASIKAGPYLTAESYQVSADVAAVGPQRSRLPQDSFCHRQ